jgi:D-3-phosphoglycerate dehydrogenase
MPMPRVLITDQNYENLAIEREIFGKAGIDLAIAQCTNDDDVLAAGREFDAFLVQYAPISGRALAQLPRLGIISRIGAGYDTIDTAACAKYGVWLANSPDYGVGEVATHALALALALIRNVVAYNRDIAGGRWHYLSSGTLRRASELTLGIVGLGRIGKRMAHVSRNVFRRIVACDPYLIDGDFPAYVERADLVALFEQSDLVSLHIPLNDETRSIVDAKVLSKMPRGSYLVNTARGALVNVDDLLAAVDSGILAGAALDVLPVEPVSGDSRLLGHPKVILTPHAAFYSAQAEIELRRKAAQNIVSWIRTGRPEYVVVAGTRRYAA